MKTSLIAFAMLASAVAAPACAEPVTVTSIVHTADLDLSSAAGERTLERRIAVAAQEVCGTASVVDLEGQNSVLRCRADTIAKASAQREQLLAAARDGRPIAFAAAR